MNILSFTAYLSLIIKIPSVQTMTMQTTSDNNFS